MYVCTCARVCACMNIPEHHSLCRQLQPRTCMMTFCFVLTMRCQMPPTHAPCGVAEFALWRQQPAYSSCYGERGRRGRRRGRRRPGDGVSRQIDAAYMQLKPTVLHSHAHESPHERILRMHLHSLLRACHGARRCECDTARTRLLP